MRLSATAPSCSLWLLLAMLPSPEATAQCAPDPVANGGTVTCSGSDADGIDVTASTNVTVDVLPGANVGPVRIRSGSVVVGQSGAPATVERVQFPNASGSPSDPVVPVLVFNYGTITSGTELNIGPVARLLVYNYGQVNGRVIGKLLNFAGANVAQLRGGMLNAGTVAGAAFYADEVDFQVTNESTGVVNGDVPLRIQPYGVDFATSFFEPDNYRFDNAGLITGSAGVDFGSNTVDAGVRRGTVAIDVATINRASGRIMGSLVVTEQRRSAFLGQGARNFGRIDGGVVLIANDGVDPRPLGDPPGILGLVVNEDGGRVGGRVIASAGRFEQRANAIFEPGTTLHPSAVNRQRGVGVVELARGTISISGTHTVACVTGDPVVASNTRPAMGRLELLSGATLTISPTVDCGYEGEINGAGTLRKTGPAAYVYSGTAIHPSTVVQQGLWFANGDQRAVTIENSGIVIGIGRMGDTLVRNGGRLAPGGTPGTLAAGSLTMQSPSVFEFEANASVSDRLDATGTVALGGATLDPRLLAGYTHQPGRAMTMIANDGTDAVTGTFANRAEGAEFTLGGFPFRIRYGAGDGNDVVLFALDPAAAVTLAPVSGMPNEGAPVTLTATVTGTAPTGVATFRDGGTPIAGCVDRPLVPNGNSATASCTTSALAAGPRSLTVVYGGDNANPTRTSTAVALTINGRPSLSAPSSLSVLEDATAVPLAISVGDAESGAADVTLSATSGDPALVTDAALAAGLGGSGANRTLAITPNADAFGSTTITLAATDPAGAVRTAPLALTVTPVNDPPTFALGGNPAHPAGTTGAQSRPGFVSQASAGPGESAQTVAVTVAELEDAANVVTDAAFAPNGTLTYTLTGAGGVARLQVTAQDNGGTADGGRDRTQRDFRIVVGNGADLQVGLVRALPDPGPGRRAYRITARNNGPADLAGVTVRGLVAAGLTDLSWTCTGTCAAASGAGAPTVVGDLAAGAVATIELHGSVDIAAPFVSLEATIAPPAGVAVLNPGDDRATLVEAAGTEGLLRDGFEPVLQRGE